MDCLKIDAFTIRKAARLPVRWSQSCSVIDDGGVPTNAKPRNFRFLATFFTAGSSYCVDCFSCLLRQKGVKATSWDGVARSVLHPRFHF